MSTPGERILLVETDPDIVDVIARQALRPLGYQVSVAKDAGDAIKQAVQMVPDLIISNLNLPGLSGKDLLVAFTSKGINAPVIVLAEKGQDQGVIQAFRLGASDYLLWPTRDAEVVAAVERVLRQLHEGRTRARLDEQLTKTNEELKRRINDLTAILRIGKAVITLNDQRVLFDQIIQGAVQVSQADMAWLLLRDDHSKAFVLVAHRNLPIAWAKKINQPLDDSVSGLVAMSGEALTIHGEPLKRFKVAALGQAVAVTPVKVKQEVIGMLVVLREQPLEFKSNEMTLLDAIADYASISMVNAKLFRALEQTLEASRASDQRNTQRQLVLYNQVRESLARALAPVEILLNNKDGDLSGSQHKALEEARAALNQGLELIRGDVSSGKASSK
jgi:DNA-binding response OmpR family regulator